MREPVFRRMAEYRESRPLPPTIVDLVSVAVTEWIDRQEKKGNE